MRKREASADPRAERARTSMKVAALELISKRHISEVTVRDVVERAGVSRPAFYLHFADVTSLMVVAMAEMLDERLAQVDESNRLLELCRTAVEHRFSYGNIYPSALSEKVSEAMAVNLEAFCQSTGVERTFRVAGAVEVLRRWIAAHVEASPSERAVRHFCAELTSLLETGQARARGADAAEPSRQRTRK